MTHPAPSAATAAAARRTRDVSGRAGSVAGAAGRSATARRRRALAVESLEDRTLFALTVTPYSPAVTPAVDLANAIVLDNTGVTVTGATFVGVDSQAGVFSGFDFRSGANRLAINDGVILTSGNATAAPSNQNFPDQQGGQDDASGELNGPFDGDADLSALVGDSTNDANSITINFTTAPGVNSILFDFVFGSEEFPDFVGSFVNDAFAAYLDGSQISFDADGNPITVDNNFFQFNNSGLAAGDFTGPNTDPDVEGKIGVAFDIEYDGLTPVIRTQAPLLGAGAHTLKLVIADTGDDLLDSAVFISRLQGSGAVIPGPVTDLPQAGIFVFDSVEYRKGENEGFLTATVVRSGGSSGLVTVDLFSTDGSASAGLDYTAFPLTTLTFVDLQSTQTITIPILDDGLAEGDENFTLTLSNATNGAGLSTTASVANAIIVDNEFGVRFSDNEYVIQEGTDTVQVTITVVLTSPSPLAPVSVDFSTIAGGSASPNVDFTPVTGTLVFAPGEMSKTFTVDILDDYIVEGADLDGDPSTPPAETINLALSNPSSPFILGLITRASVIVFDLDRPPAVLDAAFATNERFINGVALRYSEAMTEPTVEDLKNYDIYLRKESKKFGGSATRTRQEIVSAVYNEETRTVTLTTRKQLRENKVYEVVANTTRLEGIESIQGDRLDGNYDNIAGDDFAGYLSRATRISYFEVSGDRVNLQLKGPGRMELFRHVERDARILRLINTSPDVILQGTVDPNEGSDSVATIEFLLTGTGVRNKLPQPPFQIKETIAASQIPFT